ncbi:hypothetical protein MXD62_20110 [Frankia sp. Mgl5]|uniref:hypothetical protein n=1 Tax=Frankia sp. Mgl5 TaxID=2933793 RepID=UPI00200FDDF3|nr:hypothetical protein [Frankia sp. Mgl5]MCK9929456.1 hypothetical protein [Frankia sp. Mgl5]
MSDEKFRMGPPAGYVPPAAPPPEPADERTRAAALRALRQALAHRGPACQCRHGSHVHRHRNPSASHCGIRDCDCTSYRKA